MIWEHLKCFSTSFISQRDGEIVYKYWENEGDAKFLGGFSKSNKIYLFHSMNRLIPTDILTMIYLVKNGKDIQELAGYYGNISVSDALLDRILEKGVAENHLHGGVAVSFLSNWDEYMKPLTETDIVRLSKQAGKGTGFEIINSGENIFLLMLANILRMFLVIKLHLYLKEKEENPLNKKEKKKNCIKIAELTDYFIKTFKKELKEQILYFCGNNNPVRTMGKHFIEKIDLLRRCYHKEIIDLRDMFVWKNSKEIEDITDENLFLYEMRAATRF